jgi:hypothetical protein
MLTGDFVPGPDAAGAQVKANRNPIDIEGSGLNIGHPGAPGVLFGVAYPIAETQRFFTKITFDSQFRTSSILYY